MKVWLGAAAALSGAGTLAYLLVRSSRRRQGDGTSSKTSKACTGNSQDTSLRKDGSGEKLNGNIPMENHSDSVCGLSSSAQCHKEAKQHNLSEGTVTSVETCDMNAGVNRLSDNLDENLGELVSAIQERIIVKESNASNTSTCVAVNEEPDTDDKERSQSSTVRGSVTDNLQTHDIPQDAKPRFEKDRETSECISTDAGEENKVVAKSEKEFSSNALNEEIFCNNTNFSSSKFEINSLASKPTETFVSEPESMVEELSQCRILQPQCDPSCNEGHGETSHHASVPVNSEPVEPVVEELSRCRILKPQCDPSCNEGHGEESHHASVPVSSQLPKLSNKNYATFDTGETTQKESSGCISGKHIHEPSLPELFIEGQEKDTELNKDEPGTCIVTIEQMEKVYEEQIPPVEVASSQEKCSVSNESISSDSIAAAAAWKDCRDEDRADERTMINDNTKEGRSVEISGVGQPEGTAALQTPITAQEQGSTMEDAAKDQVQSGSNQETPQQQKVNASEQEEITLGDKLSVNELPSQEQSSCKEQELPQEQKRNPSEQISTEGQEQEQTATKEETESGKQEVPEEQKQSHDKEETHTGKQEHDESKQEVLMQTRTTTQEKQSASIDKEAAKQEQSDTKQTIQKQEEINTNQGTQHQQSNPRQQSGKKQPGGMQPKKQGQKKQHEMPAKQKQSNTSKQAAATQRQEQTKETRKQKDNGKEQKEETQEEQSSQKEGTQQWKDKKQQVNQEEQPKDQKKEEESDKKQQKNQKEVQSIPKQDTETQKQEESNQEQLVTEREVKSTPKNGTDTQKQEESDNKQQLAQKQGTTTQKQESDTKQHVPEKQTSHEKVTPPTQSAKDHVRGSQSPSPAKSPNNSDGGSGKKGTSVRSRSDSASADLDCDVSSEQDNLNCDSSSLKSMDSGQGSSEIEPETLFVQSTFPVTSQEQYIFYDFEIPQMLVGRLIGRKGAFINKIKAATEATVIVHPHKNRKLKLCSVEGTKQQVHTALEMIREHFPESQYPDITLQQVATQHQSMPAVQPTLNAPSMQIELTAGVVVEVRVSTVVSGGELWVQQPLHPSYSALHRLQTCMNLNYGDGSNTPLLPNPVSDGTVCVAHINDHWMRCQVLNSLNSVSLVLPLDVGGTVSLPSSSLRQIRYDYMTLPFQATQCFLHGLQPLDGDMWSDTAASVMEELVSGVILFAVVVSYTEDYVPLVNLYRRDKDQFVLLNEKMVELGHAQWITLQSAS